MDIFDEDLLRFWELLAHYDVKYIMIGGFAVNLHGFNRTTADVDIWISDTKENRLALGKVLKNYDYVDVNWETIEFIPGWTNFNIGTSITLDILITMEGLRNFSFDECYKIASIAEINQIKIPFLHINHLIENKKATNRAKDQIDVIELENIKKLRADSNLD
jgi:hypothetical protein